MRDKDQLAAGAGDRDIQTAVVEHESGPAGANERENVAGCPAETVAEVEPPGGTEMMMSVP